MLGNRSLLMGREKNWMTKGPVVTSLYCYPVLWVNTFDSPAGIGIKECGA